MMNFEAEVWEEGVKESMKNARPEAWPETGRFSDQLIPERSADAVGWATIQQFANCRIVRRR